MKRKIECSSQDGITIGLIDSIITNVRILKERDIEHASPEVLDALQDLSEMGELYFLLKANENARGISNKRVNSTFDVENNRVMRLAISGMADKIESGSIQIPVEEKKSFEYKNKLEWVPEITGFCAYVVMMSNGKMYKGFTGNFKNRMLQHFNGYGGNTTRRYPPIYIVHYEQFDTKKEAMDREKFFKTGEGLSFLKNSSNLKTIKP